MGKYYSLYNDVKLRKGGRKIAKLSEKQFGEKAKKFILDTCKDDNWTVDKMNKTDATSKIISSLPHAIRTIYYNDKKAETTIKKDFKDIQPDWENNDITGGLRTVKGCPYIVMRIGGDWECPLCVIVYYDGKQFRCYIPENGNAYRKDTKRLFGNCDASYDSKTETYTDEWKKGGTTYISDDKYAFDELVKEGILDKEKDKNKLRGLGRNIEFDIKKCIEDFVSRVEPISVKESYHRISSNDLQMIYESVIDEMDVKIYKDKVGPYKDLISSLCRIMSKLDNKIPFVKNITLTYEFDDNSQKMDLSKNIGWYAGLMIEHALINQIKRQFNNLNINNVKLKETQEDNDINNIISIDPAKNGNPVYDCKLTLGGQILKTQIKAIQKYNYNNTMNSAIRDGNDLAIIIVYIIDDKAENIYVESIEVYLPNKVKQEDGTEITSFAEYTRDKILNKEGELKKVIAPDKSKSAILITNDISSIKTLQQKKDKDRRRQKDIIK